MKKKIIATITLIVSIMLIECMWFSSKFIPVYVNGEYILANQIIRYALYMVLFGMVLYTLAYLVSESKSKKKIRRRRRR